jgi:hypothetical protein
VVKDFDQRPGRRIYFWVSIGLHSCDAAWGRVRGGLFGRGSEHEQDKTPESCLQFPFGSVDAPSCIPPALADKPDVLFGDTEFSSRPLFRMPIEPMEYDVFGLCLPLNCSLVLNY